LTIIKQTRNEKLKKEGKIERKQRRYMKEKEKMEKGKIE